MSDVNYKNPKAQEAGYGDQPPPVYTPGQVPNTGYNAPPGSYVVNQQPVYNSQQQHVIMTNQRGAYVSGQQNQNYNIALGLAFFSAFCCCPVLGIVAIILAFIGQSSSEPNTYRSYYKSSIGFSIAAIVVGAFFTAAIIGYVIWANVTRFGY